MRTLLGLLAVAAWVGCAPSIRPCADQTLFVTVTLDAATRQADRLIVDVSLEGGAARQTTLDHEPGRGSGGVQIEFPSGYPVGKTLTVTLTATLGGVVLASATSSVVLGAGCSAMTLSLQSASVADLRMGSGADLTSLAELGTPDDQAVPDGASLDDLLDLDPGLDLVADLAGSGPADQAGVENCFNDIDDNGDGKIDCEDPQCTGGASPVADCIFDPGLVAYGTTQAAPGCPSAYPTQTTLRTGFNPSTCSAGTCSCPGGGETGECYVWRYAYPSSTTCVDPSFTQFQASSSQGCVGIGAPATGSYTWTGASWIGSGACAPSGNATKVPAGFSGSEQFCAGTTKGGGCGAGKICVPHAVNHCTLAPGSLAACPTNYTARATQYYLGTDDPRTCSCSCAGGSAGACGNGRALANGCAGPSLNPPSCTLASDDAFVGINTVTVAGPTATGACGTIVSPAANGSSTPTNPQTVCCSN